MKIQMRTLRLFAMHFGAIDNKNKLVHPSVGRSVPCSVHRLITSFSFRVCTAFFFWQTDELIGRLFIYYRY